MRSRYQRLWPLVAQAMRGADVAHVWDNSRHAGPTEVLLLREGIPDGPCRWPHWAPAALAGRWPP